VEIQGEYLIAGPRERVWEALNDVDTLKECIPGCESLERVSDEELKAVVMAAIGPVKARFNTRITLENLQPPSSYTMVGESKGGAAGFGRGSATVTLTERDGSTELHYSADFKVGGKLAQVGSRLVVGATRKLADDFFGSFSRKLDAGAQRIDEGAAPVSKGGLSARTWMAVAGAALLLLIWWFLLR